MTLITFGVRYALSFIWSMLIVVVAVLIIHLVYELWLAFNIVERYSVVSLSLLIVYWSYKKL